MHPAGFWRRYAAYSLDLLVPLAVSVPLLWGTGLKMLARTQLHMAQAQLRMFELMDEAMLRRADPVAELMAWSQDPVLRTAILAILAAWFEALGVAAAVIVALAALWFIAFEASPRQATPGKRLAGLLVTNVDGSRPGPARVALRFFAGAPSWLLLHLGHALAAWRKDGRALHDLLAGTRVVLAPEANAAMPRWARHWLWAQALALAAAFTAVATQYALLLAEAWKSGLP